MFVSLGLVAGIMINADKIQYRAPVANGFPCAREVIGGTLLVSRGGFAITFESVEHVRLDLEHNRMIRSFFKPEFGKFQTLLIILAVVVYPNEWCQEQRPETFRLKRRLIKRFKIHVAIIRFKREPSKAVIYKVSINGIKRLRFQFRGFLEKFRCRTRLHRALDFMARFQKNIPDFVIAESVPKPFGLAGFQILRSRLQRNGIALVVVQAYANDVLEKAAHTVIFQAELTRQIERLDIVEFHCLLRNLFCERILRRRKSKRRPIGKYQATYQNTQCDYSREH